MRLALPWLRTFVVFVAIITLVETFFVLGIITPVVVEGSSMSPALKPGRRLWVDRTRYEFRAPQRWDIIVFRCPGRASQLCVKRVLGLPGERLSFAAGELLVDGKIVRKSLEEQMQMRQRLHREQEDRYQWRSRDNTWGWDGFAWQHKGDAESTLEFQPVLGETTDLMVTCEASLSPSATLEFRAKSYRGEVASSSSTKIVWSLFDRQAMLAIDGQVVSQEPIDPLWQDAPKLQIIATGEVTLHGLTIWRDVEYFARPLDRHPAGGQVRLAPGEFFVVGDNVAISDDSRCWAHPGLPQRLIVGAPIR